MATYVLVIEVPTQGTVSVGRIGMTHIPQGLYLYVGSAKRGLEKRIQRHVARSKKCHWHIDYILAWEGARIREVWTKSVKEECATAAAVARMHETHVVKKGLGSSDCKCPAHFFRFQAPANLIRERLGALSLGLAIQNITGEGATVWQESPASG